MQHVTISNKLEPVYKNEEDMKRTRVESLARLGKPGGLLSITTSTRSAEKVEPEQARITTKCLACAFPWPWESPMTMEA